MCAAWVDILCVTQIPGEYRINCISLLILLILQYSGFYIVKRCQVLVLGPNNWGRRLWLGSPTWAMELSPLLAILQHPLRIC